MLRNIENAVRAAGNGWTRVEWPSAPNASGQGQINKGLKQASEILRIFYDRIMAKKYRKSLSPERKASLEWKAAASTLLKKKSTYQDR